MVAYMHEDNGVVAILCRVSIKLASPVSYCNCT